MKAKTIAGDFKKVSRPELIGLLNEDLSREYQAIIGYVVYSQVDVYKRQTLTHVQRSDLPLSTKARKNTHSDVRLGLWKVFHQRFAFARRPARGCGLPSLPTHFGMYNNPINQTS